MKSYNLGIVRDLVGHGVGVELHEEPEIPNYYIPGYDYTLKTGMTIAIEPITTLGSEKLSLVKMAGIFTLKMDHFQLSLSTRF